MRRTQASGGSGMANGSDKMPGSSARRKRDNSVEPMAGIRSSAARGAAGQRSSATLEESRRDADAVFRVEQDHCIGADRNDRRDGRRHSRQRDRASETPGKGG